MSAGSPLTPATQDPVRKFIDFVSVKPAGEDLFLSETPYWGFERVFGGVILGQAVHAAASTVSGDKRIQSLHGYFLRPALAGRPLEFRVDRMREGRSETDCTRCPPSRDSGTTELGSS